MSEITTYAQGFIRFWGRFRNCTNVRTLFHRILCEKINFQITRERLNRDVAFLAGQITMLEQAAMREEEKIEDLKLKCEMFR